MQVRILCCTAILLLVLGAGTAIASNPDRIGTGGAMELQIPNTARGLALGGGLVADPGGVETLFYNPAGLAGINKVEAYFSNFQYIADMRKNYVVVGANVGFGTIAVAADVLSIGDIIETTEDAPEGTGTIFSPNFSLLSLSYGRYMTDLVTVGGTFKVINESILQERATGICFDAGVQYKTGLKGLELGLAMKNFGPNMTFNGSDFETFHSTSDNPQAGERALSSLSASFELPSYFEFGARYALPLERIGNISGYGAFQSNNFNRDFFSLGAEASYQDILFIRGGGVFTGNKDNNFGPAFGAGFVLPLGGETKIQADYTMRIVKNYFNDNHMLALKFVF